MRTLAPITSAMRIVAGMVGIARARGASMMWNVGITFWRRMLIYMNGIMPNCKSG